MNESNQNQAQILEKSNNQSMINNNIRILNNENDSNIGNNIINNSLDVNNSKINSKASFKISLSNNSQIEIPVSQFNPSQFSFKQRSNESFSFTNNINISFEQYNTPRKTQVKNEFEKMLTVEKLRQALAPPPILGPKNEEIPRFKTEVKHFPKYPEFKKVTFDDLPELETMILDDVDKKAFNIYEKVNFPSIEEMAEMMRNKNIKEEDFDFYSSLCYLLFIKKDDFSPLQRQLILKNLPFYILNDFFANYQNNSLNTENNNSIFYYSSSPSQSVCFPTKNINTLSMILNIIILCIQNDEDMKMFMEYFGKDDIFFLIDNMLFLLQSIENFRVQRKILGLFAKFFMYNDEIILNYLRKLELSIDTLNISTNIIIKLQQILKNKQKKYIGLIVGNKKEIEEKIKKNDIESICYIIRFLIFILSGSQGNYLFDEKEYISILKFFKELNIRNQKLEELIFHLKVKIKRLI